MRTTTTIILILISCFTYGQGNGLYIFLSEDVKYGFMDKNGKIKIKAEYRNVSEFSEGLCFVSKEVLNKDFKRFCIDTLGNKVFDIQDNYPDTKFSEGFARIKSFEEHWFVNKNGINEFGKTWKDGHGEFINGIAYVSDKKFFDFYPINTKGERIGNKTYTGLEVQTLIFNETNKLKKKKAHFQSNYFVPFKKNGLWGFKDSHNLYKVVIEPRFYKVDKFENGVCAVQVKKPEVVFLNDNFMDAIIDENGNVLNEVDMHCYMGFQGELIQFYGAPHFGGGVHYLNNNGQRIIPRE